MSNLEVYPMVVLSTNFSISWNSLKIRKNSSNRGSECNIKEKHTSFIWRIFSTCLQIWNNSKIHQNYHCVNRVVKSVVDIAQLHWWCIFPSNSRTHLGKITPKVGFIVSYLWVVRNFSPWTCMAWICKTVLIIIKYERIYMVPIW